ncbi:5-oxoprolinase subunit PxpA [Microtetraspora malaysiensis]|uniref:5-oxoprolinase subunit PxpA n=1 Tax=Microtetraspora malaysiensis TaxID=161358 RepID=UPI003D8BE390
MILHAPIDLNADVGEGFGRWSVGDDTVLLPLVTSANIACGFHAGDPVIMRRTCELAVRHAVRIGAHIGYSDLAGFGRREIGVPAAELRDEVSYQLGGLAACAALAGGRVTYLKPHGALYHRCGTDPAAAEAVVRAAHGFDPALCIVGAPGSHLLTAARHHGMRGIAEGFADRRYRPDGTLTGREDPGGVLGARDAADQAARIAEGRPVITSAGTELILNVRTVCVHGDRSDAADVARAIHRTLNALSRPVVAFT